MTPEQLALIAGAVLSLLFSYIPGLKNWFEGLSPEYKRLFMAGVLLVAALALFGGSCLNLWGYFVCSWLGLWEAVKLWLLAVAANQTIYLVSPGVHSKK